MKKKKKGQTTIYKTLHRRLEIEQHEHHKRQVVESGAAEGLFRRLQDQDSTL